MAIPSSQATPMCTCPGLRPRRCPEYSRITHPGLLPSTVCKASAFIRRLPDYPNDHDYTYFGAQLRGLHTCSVWLRTPVTGLTRRRHY